LTFRVADPDGRYAAVRLCSDLPLSEAARSFERAGGEWVLRIADPPLTRLEYQLELEHAGGGREIVRDPGNPQQAPGVFGEKSVRLLPGYRPPEWLDGDRVAGEFTELAPRGRGLRANVQVRIWSPAGPAAMPVLVAHDGHEYEALSRLIQFSAAKIAAGEVPPHRVALLQPGHRDEWYSGSALYARALVTDVLPALDARGPRIAMGASLGGLALLHAHRLAPFNGLFLQSGSFFVPRHDAQEARFPRYRRIVRVVRELHREAGEPVPVTMTCGAAEENLANNREMVRALVAQGFDAELHEVGDTHNYTAWRDAFDPYLTRLLARWS
jgi:enterochelin esterase family protein